MISQALQQQIISALRETGDRTPIRNMQPANPGGVSNTAYLLTERSKYFLKWNETPWFGSFTTEAFHLSLLRQTETVRVPEVIAFAESQNGSPAWMLQEWIGGASTQQEHDRLGAQLGEKLAALHWISAVESLTGYGYVMQGNDGSINHPDQEWATFLYEAHLRHHIEQARSENRWSTQRNQRIDRLIERLPLLLSGVRRSPSLLHGDLHSCNVRCASNGEPVVADPWTFYGDREVEIVTTLVSGDFPSAFYQAYNAVYPLEPGFEDLYRLIWYLSPGYYVSQPDDVEANNAIADPILENYVG
jgi:protein-ribulosamine 3-kinase